MLDFELKKRVENLIDVNARELLKSIYRDARIVPNEAERENYYNKHIRTLKLVIDECGTMKIV